MIVVNDDGTLDTVLTCTDCHETWRFTYQPFGEQSYEDFVTESLDIINTEHICGQEQQ